MTPMQKAERDIEELRQSIHQMFSDLLSLSLELTPEDRAAARAFNRYKTI